LERAFTMPARITRPMVRPFVGQVRRTAPLRRAVRVRCNDHLDKSNRKDIPTATGRGQGDYGRRTSVRESRNRTSYASPTGSTRGKGCRRINGALAYSRNANRSPHGPPRPEQRRQSSYGSCQRKCGNAGSYSERVASERRHEPEWPRSRPQRASRSNASGQRALVCVTSLAPVEAAGGVRRLALYFAATDVIGGGARSDGARGALRRRS
jgi:hypothetical protein